MHMMMGETVNTGVVDEWGFPYYSMYTTPPSQFHSTRRLCIAEVIEELTNYGCGIWIDPHREPPRSGAILTFGALWGFRENGKFIRAAEVIEEEDRSNYLGVLNGKPNDKILPHYARNAIRGFMSEMLGIKKPSVYLQSDPGNEILHTFVFNIVDGTQEEEVIYRWMEGLMWFMHPGYGVGACETSWETKKLLMPL